MNLDRLHLDQINKSQDLQGVSNQKKVLESPESERLNRFDDLLESLQRIRLTGKGDGDPEGTLLEFGKALEKADQAHRTVMDLSRQLEDAYRKALGKQS